MSKNLLAMIALVIVVGAVYLWMQANRSFNWAARYAHDGDEPFDCEIFDSIASATMPKGYTFWQESFDSLMHVPGKKSLLIINKTWAGDSTAFLRLDSCVRAGCKVLWVLENNAMWLGEKYSLNASYDYADVDTLAKSLKGQLPLDTLEWVGSNPVTTTINQGLFSSWFRWGYDRRFKVTAWVSSSSLKNLINRETCLVRILTSLLLVRWWTLWKMIPLEQRSMKRKEINMEISSTTCLTTMPIFGSLISILAS